MGRKKKAQPKEVEPVISADAFSYSGKINVSLQKNGKTYFTKTYKNSGRWPLFYFLNICLRGDYEQADIYRPRFIDLFGLETLTGQNVPTIIDPETNGAELHSVNKYSTYFNNSTRVSLMSYPYMSDPDISVVNTSDIQIGSSKITYKFTIPFTQLNLNNANPTINAFTLTWKQGNFADANAFFFITDDQNKVVNLLAGLNGAALGDEYNFYIEWTLKITNPAKPQTE